MFIGIDLGTTACKTVMFDNVGRVLSEYNKEYDLIFDGNFVEQDANEWWRLVQEGISFVVRETGITNVAGISVSTQSISFVPVDKGGNTLYNAISWLDIRASEYANLLSNSFGDKRIFDITGKSCVPDYSYPKLLWFKENKNDIYKKTYKFLFPLDFINLRLTGNPLCDYTVASGSMLYDIHKKCWSEELASISPFDITKLPEVACLGTEVGFLKDDVCEITGITKGCKVYLGGQDQKLAAIGAGITENVCTVSFGTATAISKLEVSDNCSVSQFRFDEDNLISEIALMTTGAALKWLTNTLYSGISYKEMDELASLSKPGAGGVVFNSDLTVGGSISGITLSTTKSDIVYALYEGVSKEISKAVKLLGGAENLLVFGGGSKSKIWCQILSDVCKIKVTVLETAETASLGAAIIASQFSLPPAKSKFVFN